MNERSPRGGSCVIKGLILKSAPDAGSKPRHRGHDRADAGRGRFPTGNERLPGRDDVRWEAWGWGEEKKNFTTEPRNAWRRLVQLETGARQGRWWNRGGAPPDSI